MKHIVLLLFVLYAVRSEAFQNPNIILIMADDQGWNGTSVQMDPSNEDSNSDFYETPNIERIANSGMRFSRAYAPAPKCSPTRMSILTGQTTARNQFTNTSSMVAQGESLVEPSSNTRITAEHFTIAEQLQNIANDYLSAHFGKWHIGNNGPTSHGFSEGDGATGNDDGESGTTINTDPKKIFELTNKGISFMEGAMAEGKPFYLQLSHYAVHTSIEYTQDSFDKYNAKTSGTTHTNQEFAAMTEDLDTGVGMILDFLEENNLTGDTYVIYYSDNGAQSNVSPNDPLMGSKTLLFEGGIRVPLIISGPGIEADSHSDVPVIGYDFFPTFSEWAGGSEDDLPNDLDGVSLVSLVSGSSSFSRADPLIFHSPHYDNSPTKEPRSAIISDDAKLLVEYEEGTRLQYELSSDLGETQNVFSDANSASTDLLLALRDYLKEVDAQMPALSQTLEDVDEDGLPDVWEFENLLGTHYDGSDDPDGDNVSNSLEYAMGLDPLTFDENATTGVIESKAILYPIPVNNTLNVHFDDVSEHRFIEIFSVRGEQLIQAKAGSTENLLELDDLIQGTYYYRITDGTLSSVGKIVKE